MSVTVTPVNDPPVAVDDTGITTPEDTAAVIPTATLTGNDTDIDGGPLTVTAVSDPIGGTVVLNGNNTITFTPTANTSGPASFTYTVSDGAGGTDTATVSITVTPVNDPPVAVDDTGITTPEDTAAVIPTATLTGNDTDIDGGPLTVTAVSDPIGGTVVLNGNNTITFTPTANTSGPASFTYTVSDGAGGTDTATVSITVTPVNDPPIAVDDTGITTAEDTAAAIADRDVPAQRHRPRRRPACTDHRGQPAPPAAPSSSTATAPSPSPRPPNYLRRRRRSPTPSPTAPARHRHRHRVDHRHRRSTTPRPPRTSPAPWPRTPPTFRSI